MIYGHPKHLLSEGEAAEALTSYSGIAVITTATAGRVEATHLPVIFEPPIRGGGFGRLIGHLARGNDHWRSMDDTQCLVICAGAQAYISPGSYETKIRTGKVVPTWNYEAIHIRGTIRTTQDPEKLRAIVERLTQRHEATQNDPWQVTDAPVRYIEQQLAGIVGFEVLISEISAKRKMSQEKSAADRQGIIAGLRRSDDTRDERVGAIMAQLETQR